MKFNYEWMLSDAVFLKDKGSFSAASLVVEARLWVINWRDLM